MRYALYCSKHKITTTPLYWRPEGKTFRRCYNLHWCPGTDNDPHIIKYRGFRIPNQDIPLDTA